MRHRRRGIALAGGGPLGGIYEIGALVALDEALLGFDPIGCDVYVGVSSGSFIAAGLANGITPRTMHRIFIESATADDPFEPELLLRPALREYVRRAAAAPQLFARAMLSYFADPGSKGFFESFLSVTRSLPTGVFDQSALGDYLAALFDSSSRTNDFRKLRHKLFVVATDLDSGQSVPFGAVGWDDVPISKAVQASAALPGLYPPVKIHGRHYVDGALMKTLHASVALREGVKLLLCINPLVPFDAELARRSHKHQTSLVEGGLPAVLSQTFRAIIHSRMQVGMDRYRSEFPDADVLLFEPSRDDVEMFFANVFSYSDRRRLSEHAYQHTRAELRRRAKDIEPILSRHGVRLDHKVLDDDRRVLARRLHRIKAGKAGRLGRAIRELDETLEKLEGIMRAHPHPAR